MNTHNTKELAQGLIPKTRTVFTHYHNTLIILQSSKFEVNVNMNDLVYLISAVTVDTMTDFIGCLISTVERLCKVKFSLVWYKVANKRR